MKMRNYLILTLHLLILLPCAAQSSKNNEPGRSADIADTMQKRTGENTGILYFSSDNGNTWKNASAGIPQKVSIGMGGLAVSANSIGIATKEYGVFMYNLKDSIWVNLPTEQQIIADNIGALNFYKNSVYVGTQLNGIYVSNDKGKTWAIRNTGLRSLTIRRFFESENKLYVCANDGFYLFDETTGIWKPEYVENLLQVNGAALFNEFIYIATNKGVYQKNTGNGWKNVLPDHSVHNISSDNGQLYAMTYNKLLLSSKDGTHWQSLQNGLPDLYTFNILRNNEIVFAGQWDGIYRRTNTDNKWQPSGNGLPSNFAVTNLKSFKGVLVITTSERKLKTGN